MGLIMSPETVKMQLDSMNQELDNVLSNAQNVLDKITAFEETTDFLIAESYDNIRDYYSEVQVPFVQGCILLAESLVDQNVTYKSYISGCLSGIGYVDEDALLRDKEHIEQQIANVRNLMNTTPGSYSSYLSNLEYALSLIEKKLLQIEEFCALTVGLYQNIDAYYSNLKSGINCMNSSVGSNEKNIAYDLTSVDLTWSLELKKIWDERERELETVEIEIEEVDGDSIWNELYGTGKTVINIYNTNGMETAIKFIKDGVRYKLVAKDGKYYLQMSTRVDYVGTVNVWNPLKKFMKENVKDVDWDKYMLKQLMRGGEKINSNRVKNFFIENTKYEELAKAIDNAPTNTRIKSRLLSIGKSAKSQFGDSLKFWDDFNPKYYGKGSSLSKIGKAAKCAGAFTTVVNVGVNAKEAFWEDDEFEVDGAAVQEFAVDTTVDIVADAGAAAAGAAVGSLFLPPVGTAVGAVAGVAVGLVLDCNFFDTDNDGKGDLSIKEGVKNSINGVIDGIKGLFS